MKTLISLLICFGTQIYFTNGNVCTAGFGDDWIAIFLNHFTAYFDKTGQVKAEWP